MQASSGSLLKGEKKKQLVVVALLGLVVLFALFGLRFIKFNNDIKVMLPQQEEILKTFDFFKESPSKNTECTGNIVNHIKFTQSHLTGVNGKQVFKALKSCDQILEHISDPQTAGNAHNVGIGKMKTGIANRIVVEGCIAVQSHNNFTACHIHSGVQ